jgi:hypothetical protein
MFQEYIIKHVAWYFISYLDILKYRFVSAK